MNRDPLRRRPGLFRRERGGFKTVALNAVGWSALIATGLVLGAIVVLATGIPAVVSLPAGVLGTWVLLLSLDHFRWRNLPVHIGRAGMNPEIGASIVARLQDMGIAASYREDPPDDDLDDEQRGIVCRQADAETVRKVMAESLTQT